MSDIAKHILACIALGGDTVSRIDPDSVRLSPNLKQLLESEGSLYPLIGVSLSAEPVIEFTTSDITLATYLGTLSAENPAALYFRALSDAGLLGTAWISAVATSGMIEPVSVEGAKGNLAKLKVRVHLASSDGDTAPLTIGSTSATPAVPTAYYTIGALTVSSALSGVQNFTLNYGYSIKKDTEENGAPYPSIIYCDGQAAEITAQLEQLAFATQTRLLQGGSETTVTMQFRKVLASGMPSTTGGYQITAQKAAVSIGNMAGGKPASVELSAKLIATAWDGTSYIQAADIT